MSRTPFLSREAYPQWIEIQTRWADNDIYGHVNNTVYYQWFDVVVNRWLLDRNLLVIGGQGPIGLVVETGCRYAKPLSFPQSLDVGLRVQSVGNSSVTYQIGIFASSNDQAAAEGHFVHVYVDPESRRPVTLPANWREALQELQTT
jgi:acyl-CoA thioester hydrolase